MKKKNILQIRALVVLILIVVLIIALNFFNKKSGSKILSEPVINQPELIAKNIMTETSSVVIADQEEIPLEAIKFGIINGSFLLPEFTVKPGTEITLALNGDGKTTHAIIFDSFDLAKAPFILIEPNDKRVVTFKAPEKAGEYNFRCTISGHEKEVGKMIVN